MAPDVTVLLDRVREGDASALDRVIEQLYDELRSVAHRQRVRNGAAPTVNTTAVVHEAYAKLAGRSAALDLNDRQHFVRVASRAMRDVIVDYARAQSTEKRGGDGKAASLDEMREVGVTAVSPRVDLDETLSVDTALDKLAQIDEQAARVAELRYFAGLTNEETAEVLGVSLATSKRRWTVARAWLARHLADS